MISNKTTVHPYKTQLITQLIQTVCYISALMLSLFDALSIESCGNSSRYFAHRRFFGLRWNF